MNDKEFTLEELEAMGFVEIIPKIKKSFKVVREPLKIVKEPCKGCD